MKKWLELIVAVLSLSSSVVYLTDFFTSKAVLVYLTFLGSESAKLLSFVFLTFALLGLLTSPFLLFTLVRRQLGSNISPDEPRVSRGQKKANPEERATLGQSPTIAKIDDVVSWGWDGKRLLDELIRIDYETIDGLTTSHEGNRNQWSPVFMDHPDTWRLLIEGREKIVGYWHFVPLFDEEYQLAKEGKLLDGQITTDKVRLFEVPGLYNIYFVSICVMPHLRHTASVRKLFNSLYETIAELARDSVFIDEVCANAYSPSGKAVCKSFGMDYLRNHTDHGQIWIRKFFPFKPKDPLLQNRELVQLYTHKFSQPESPPE